ncbi:MAG: hypothetical protein K8I02_08480, partial [Candidatus Methylomirabilis sp.]|nr:hypothetical protein [Deltaproteobacteria bacterium]
PPGASPIFTSGRKVRETFSENGIFVQLRAELFDFFETFYALPEVAPFTGDPRFQRAVHSMVEERTDFDYYRANPGRLRVVDKVVDGISLAETQVRADAFRAAFDAKRDHYQAETEKLVLAHGMLASSLAADYTGEDPDGDGALWTGVYCWTQAARWKATGDPAALDEVRRTLRGILTLMDITGDPKRFARTLRLAGPPITGNWVRGTGAFAAYDWLAGGNNDMSKGLLLGMVAGWDALPEGDPLRDEIPAHALALLDLCEFLRVRPEECGGGDSDLPFPSLNPGIAELIAGIANDRADLVAAGLEWLHDEYLYLYPGLGGGPFYVYGISDWSGNHLTLATNLSLLWALERAGDAELLARWKRSTGIAYEQLRTLESPLHAAFGLRYAGFESASQEVEALDQALWGLRSFPFPKHPWRVDHRIRDDFVLSPWPSLPWKFDWETNPGRQQSLVGFPMVESSVDGFRWNGSPYSIADGPLGDRRYPGADYLFLYWLAREAGIISDGE